MKALLLSVLVVFAPCSWARVDTQHVDMLANKLLSKKKSKSKRRRSKPPRPFIFRLLYMPSYRFFSDNIKDDPNSGSDVTNIFPVMGGIEGEVVFNRHSSLSLGGSFLWEDTFVDNEKKRAAAKKDKQDSDVALREISLYSALHFKAGNHFKIGTGVVLSRRTIFSSTTGTEDKKKMEGKLSLTNHSLSAQLAVRRDVFFNWGGFGLGLNLILPLYRFYASIEAEVYEDGEKKYSGKAEDKWGDVDDLKFFSFIIMPILYFAI